MMRKFVLVMFGALTLSGCGLFKTKDNIQPPTPLAKFTPTLAVKRLWETGVGNGAGDSGVRLAPAVADGVVYAVSTNGDIEALALASGKQLWSVGTHWREKRDTRYSSGPAVAGDLLVVGTLDGHVYGFDAKTGKPRWQATVSSEVISPPVIVGDRVLVRCNDGHIYALAASDGKQLWLYDRGSVPTLSLRGNGTLLVAGGAVFFGSDDGKLVALNLTEGSSLWEQRLATGEGRTEIQRLDDSDGSLVLDGGVLYANAYHGSVAAVQAEGGRILWSRPLSGYTGVAVGGGTVIAIDDASNVWALDKTSGADVWKQNALDWRWLSAPAIQGKYVVVGDLQGYVHWLDLATGQFAAREHLSGKAIRARPLIVGDIAVVADDVGHIAAYRIQAQ